MRLKSVCILLVALMAGPAMAQTPTPTPPPAPPPPPPLSGSLSAGVAVSSGNTDTSSVNFAFTMAYVPGTKNSVKADGLVLRGKSNGALTVDRTALSGRDEYALTTRAYLFGQLQFLHDRFKDVDYLIAPTAGLGYKLVTTPATTLSADAGIGGQWEKDTGQTVSASGAVTAGQKLTQKLSATATITEAVSALWKASAFGDALYTFGGGLALAVTTHVQFKIEVLDTYKTRPPLVTVKKNDTATILALVYKFAKEPAASK